MIQSFFTGANGLRSQQFNLDVIANNISNIGTVGFKQARTDFKETLYNRMINPVDSGDQMNFQHGTGVLPMQANRIFEQGVALTTDRSLDFMLQEDGFFTVEGDDGEMLYTRNGSFLLSTDESENYLITEQGHYVLDENGDRITIYGSLEQLSVTPNGYLVFVMDDEDGPVASDIRLGVVNFVNPVGLEVVGGNMYRATENSGEAEYMESPMVFNRALEGSNVDYGLEATRMIRAQRAYQLASRCITTADQMAGLANTIRQ